MMNKSKTYNLLFLLKKKVSLSGLNPYSYQWDEKWRVNKKKMNKYLLFKDMKVTHKQIRNE